jgi:hypothetical protein
LCGGSHIAVCDFDVFLPAIFFVYFSILFFLCLAASCEAVAVVRAREGRVYVCYLAASRFNAAFIGLGFRV